MYPISDQIVIINAVCVNMFKKNPIKLFYVFLAIPK